MSAVNPRSRRRTRAAAVVLVLVMATGSAAAQTVSPRTLRIDSIPAGAKVELIGGAAGATPLTINERDIYPNDYPDARASMYGMVLLRHAGCVPVQHRVTLTDVQQGLHIRLDCDAATAALEVPPRLSAAPPVASPAVPPTPGTIPERRLRQLQVLQELLDEGMISPSEEQRIRRRILNLEIPGG